MAMLSVFGAVYNLTTKEQNQILEEADNWIDDMPDGMQDRLSDAVGHAMKGFYNEVQYFRNLADTAGIGKYPVLVKTINGGSGGTIPMRVYEPKKKASPGKLPILIYFHGGGWSLGSLNSTERFCRALASEGNVKVVSVDYSLAPEKPYPAGVLEAVDAIEYIIKNYQTFDCDVSRINLGGDGAGGNIALEAYSSLPSSDKIHSIVLYYPMISKTGQLDIESKRKYGRGFGFDSRLWDIFITAYNAPKNLNFSNLPPTLVISSGRDILISEEKDFSFNKNVTLVQFEGAIHGFITDGHQKTAFKKAVSITDSFLNQ